MEKIDIAKTVDRYTEAVKTVESPIELLFQVNFSGYLNSKAQLIPQYELITKRGKFRADFMFIPPSGERIIIECDGKEFHDPLRDSFRDAFILGSDCADAIYRINGKTIYSELSRVIEYILLGHHDALTDKAVNKFSKSQLNLLLVFCKILSVISSSPTPASLKTSSSASSLRTVKTSSPVIMPTNLLSLSTTPAETRL